MLKPPLEISNDRLRLVTAFLLPVRPRPKIKESTAGYIARVAYANGYLSVRQFFVALQDPSENSPYVRFCERIALSATERRYLLGPCASYWGKISLSNPLTIADYNQAFLRWCPLCLNESSCFRSEWMFKLSCVCTRHSILLVDRCSACKKMQRAERAGVARCLCGAKFETSTSLIAPKFLLNIQERLISNDIPSVIAVGISALTNPELCRLVKYLGPFYENSRPEKPGQIAGLNKLSNAFPIFYGCSKLLDEWPDNFVNLLDQLHQPEMINLSIRKTFGRLYRVLYCDLKSPCFQFIRNVFEEYLHRHWWGHIRKRNRLFRKQTIAEHPRLTVDQVAQMANSSPAFVGHLIQANLLSASEMNLASGRKSYSLHSACMPKIAALANANLTLIEAAQFLSLPRRRIMELINAKIINPLISKTISKSARWYIPKAELDRLCFSATAIGNREPCISMAHMIKYWGLAQTEFPHLVLAILSGELLSMSPSVENVSIGKTKFDLCTAKRWLLTYRNIRAQDFSVAQAAKALKIKQEVAYGLVKSGLLFSTNCQGREKIRKQDIELFGETFISLADVARMKKCSPRYFLKVCLIKPACGPSIDGFRQYFYRRADIKDIIF